jgi:lantibiotic leader peptide-processing serine protease
LRRPVSVTRLLVFASAVGAGLALAGPAAAERYVVLYRNDDQAAPARARDDVEQAGGTLVAGYRQIGVAIAESSEPSFARDLNALRRVIGVAATGAAAGAADGQAFAGDLSADFADDPVADGDTFSPLQWWARRIHAPEAHAITGGSPAVVVGVIDTGADATHPDLDDTIDASRSVSCVSGAPDQDPAAWSDDSGHGTNVAGIIAAEANGQGIVGIAPNVKLAIIKAGVHVGSSDFFLPEAVICSLVWAGGHGIDVANNSYSVDSAPGGGTTSFCVDDEAQRTVVRAVKRALQYATGKGVSAVASAGNNGRDLADPATDGCLRLPSQLPGVITVSSIGVSDRLAAAPSSNWGLGVVDVTAPGGDILQTNPALPMPQPPGNLVLGPWPAAFQVPRLLCDPCDGADAAFYRFFAGTSQAAAEVSGVAALVVGRFGEDDGSGEATMNPWKVGTIVKSTADPLPCPDGDARCVTTNTGQTSFFGNGVVNAFRAVTEGLDP